MTQTQAQGPPTRTTAIFLALLALLPIGCMQEISYRKFVPANYWYSLPSFDEVRGVPELRQGMIDGCRSSLKRRNLPGYLRSTNAFTIDGNLVGSSQYQSGFSRGYVWCALKGGYFATKSPFSVPSMLDMPIPSQLNYRK